MTVKEMIQELQAMDQDSQVRVRIHFREKGVLSPYSTHTKNKVGVFSHRGETFITGLVESGEGDSFFPGMTVEE